MIGKLLCLTGRHKPVAYRVHEKRVVNGYIPYDYKCERCGKDLGIRVYC